MAACKRDKLFRVLDAVIQPNVHISNDCYLEMLITHLSDKDKAARDILRSPQIIEWIDGAVKRWEQAQFPETHVLAFCVRLIAVVLQNEWQFSVARDRQFLDRIQRALKAMPRDKQTPTVHLANVLLLHSVATHSMGLLWIKQEAVWRVVVEYCCQNQTVYVVREGLRFVYGLLRRFSVDIGDMEFVDEVLETICRPIVQDNPISDLLRQAEDVVVRVDDQEQLGKIEPALNLVCYVMEQMITGNECHEVARLLVGRLKEQHYMWGLADLAQDHAFIGRLMHGHVLINFTQSMLRRSEEAHDQADFNAFGVDFFNFMSFCVMRRSGNNIIAMAEQYHRMWGKIQPPPPDEVVIEGERIRFQDQVIMLQILPIIYVIGNYRGNRDNRESLREQMDKFVIQLFNISCARTIRLAYSFRAMLDQMDPDYVAHLATKSIQAVLGLKETMHRSRAVLVLQALVYTLQPQLSEVGLLLRSPQLISAILTGLHTLIKWYRITWKECLESTVLVAFMLELLNNPNLSTRHAVQALQLLQLSIEHFLAPNLALLVDTLQGSGMESLGAVIFKKLHDPAWEIRDSTLELLASMVHLSKDKFPPFQNHILESGVCPLVFTLVQHDPEAYVRAAALQCLTEMATVGSFWAEALSPLDLVPYLMQTVLLDESEGVVRREGVVLLTAIYEKRRLCPPKDSLDHVYSVMTYCAVKDLYWEVKTNALRFWLGVMCRQFQDQGVIDNTFPAVTFSREHKKIVQLTPAEIHRRITKVLEELSARGTLGVFLHCLDETADLEVVKVTVTIVQRLQSFLDKYNYMKEVVGVDGDGDKAQPPTQVPSSTAPVTKAIDVDPVCGPKDLKEEQGSLGTDSDVVIDGIVDAKDLSLLTSAYENQLKVKMEEEGEEEEGGAPRKTEVPEDYYKRFATVTPVEFLRKVYAMDLEALVENRSTWFAQIENFDSLLDDILLGLGEENLAANDADCY